MVESSLLLASDDTLYTISSCWIHVFHSPNCCFLLLLSFITLHARSFKEVWVPKVHAKQLAFILPTWWAVTEYVWIWPGTFVASQRVPFQTTHTGTRISMWNLSLRYPIVHLVPVLKGTEVPDLTIWKLVSVRTDAANRVFGVSTAGIKNNGSD